MSPSSAGNGSSSLEVEHYIGSYLISSTARPKNNQRVKVVNNYHPREMHTNQPQRVYTPTGPNVRYPASMTNCAEGWAGGMPLISMANHQRRTIRKNNIPTPCPNQGNQPVDEFRQQTPLSRLAIHTHGFPLILAGRYHTRKNPNYPHKYASGAQTNGGRHEAMHYPKNGLNNNTCDSSKDNSMVSNIDTLSVASDESSGSNHSENCLPRIIKPRKRRKKDRKPTPVLKPATSDQSSLPSIKTESSIKETKLASTSSLVTLQPYVPKYYNNNTNSVSKIHHADSYSDQVKVVTKRGETNVNISIEISDIPKLIHEFDDVADISQNQCSPISCQCKFCDPSGQIWDVDSPFLTNTESVFFNNSITYPPTSNAYSYKQCSADDDLIVDRMASALRRSWSDPVSSFGNGDDIEFSAGSNVGVIGAGRLCREWHGNPSVSSGVSSHSSRSGSCISANSQILDISTEIVTSHNGHRDLEIKFFTSLTSDDNDNESPGTTNNISPALDADSKLTEWNVDNRHPEDKDCDISYDTADIGRLLLEIEE